MCGRYAASRKPEDLVEEFEVDRVALGGPLEPDYNVAPTKPVPVVLTRRPRMPGSDERGAPERQLRVVRWGLVPSWAKDPKIGNRMINARKETVAEKPAFRRAFAARRCLLPADGYYEWYEPQADASGAAHATDERDGGKGPRRRPRKQPFFIRSRDGSALAMAGLYELWRDRGRPEDDPEAWLWTTTVLTTSAPDDLGRIHDRMPLLVPRDQWTAWLDPDLADPRALLDALVPAAPGRLEAYPVSTEVNDVRNNGAHLLDPLPAEPSPSGEGASDETQPDHQPGLF